MLAPQTSLQACNLNLFIVLLCHLNLFVVLCSLYCTEQVLVFHPSGSQLCAVQMIYFREVELLFLLIGEPGVASDLSVVLGLPAGLLSVL